MLIAKFVTARPELANSRTYEDFSKFLGVRPERLGIVSRLYPQHTASFLTESLMNVWYNDTKAKKFSSINALQFEWEIDVNFIKRIEFNAVPVQIVGQEYSVEFKERYYEKYDTFKIESGTGKQQMIVLAEPVRATLGAWTYHCQLIDAEFSSTLDLNSCQPGMTTLFMSNYHPEYHEEGYTKYQSNIERHRNYIAVHRNDISFSAQFAATEEIFLSISKGEDNGKAKESLFKMNKKEKDVFDSFMFARNNALLFGKNNHDVNGKCTVYDPHTGRPIPMGDGIISQVERFASRYVYGTNKLTVNAFDTAILQMNEKAANPIGNHYVFVCNERLFQQVQTTLREYLRDWKTTGTFLFSQKAGGDVEVGATYKSYEFMGNTITFQVDRALSREYPGKGYGLFLDLTADKATGTPAIQMFTFKGGEFISNKLKGVGGFSGLESGEVFSPVAGSKLINWGYAGVGVFSPYRSFVLMEA